MWLKRKKWRQRRTEKKKKKKKVEGKRVVGEGGREVADSDSESLLSPESFEGHSAQIWVGYLLPREAS